MSVEPQNQKEELILRLGTDHRLAHQALFAHRHPDATPDFHYEIIDDLHGPSRRVLELAFRGAAKSTIAEEYIAIDACYRRFRNFIIVGESFTRASERLAAVKHELDFNENIRELFGDLHGSVWNEDKIELANGVVIQAFGRGQSLRGVKHNDQRPDGCLIDDIEDEESVSSLDGRDKVQRWVMRTLIPALAPGAKVRMLANMLDPDCLAVRLKKTGRWVVREYPWEYISPVGARVATWPSRFSLVHIDDVRNEYERSGMLNEYMQEYMVEAIDPSTRTFTSDILNNVKSITHLWHPTYAMYDPARTTKATSSHTGKVVFSWIGTKLVVWEAQGELWMPDKIVSDMFDTWEKYHPINIGVEKEGLEEFIMQPLRTEQLKRRQILPIKFMPAPKGKDDFIRGLQPYFKAGDVEFAKELPVLREQLLSFPTGRKDVPNALAYATRMRAGLAVFDNFSFKNVVVDMESLRGTACYLALNANRQFTTGVLCQVAGGAIRIFADWVKEGDPGAVLQELADDAVLLAGGKVTAFAGSHHWGTHDTVGLRAAAMRCKLKLNTAGHETAGREDLRRRIDMTAGQLPLLLVSSTARWSLNAFCGGYALSVVKAGVPDKMVDDGPYKILIEGVECFAAATSGAMARDGEDKPNYAVDPQGRRYLSARATHERHNG